MISDYSYTILLLDTFCSEMQRGLYVEMKSISEYIKRIQSTLDNILTQHSTEGEICKSRHMVIDNANDTITIKSWYTTENYKDMLTVNAYKDDNHKANITIKELYKYDSRLSVNKQIGLIDRDICSIKSLIM